MRQSVAVIGGGITGLTAAYTLLKAGAEVTVYEANPEVGGLSVAQDFGPFEWDRFYHCILTSDRELLGLLRELGLEPSLRWRKTSVGFYSDNTLHNMTSPADLLRYPCLSLIDKMRFGLGILYAGRICKGKGLDAEPLEPWVRRVFGENLQREIWDPLLRCKLGEMRHEASASFLWSTIRRLYSTRDKSIDKKECLGYVAGGYRTVIDRLLQRIYELGGKVRWGVSLDAIDPVDAGIGVSGQGSYREYDACLMTAPAPAIASLVPELSPEYRKRLAMPRYLGMVCVALVLRRALSPYYLTNVTQTAPFTGVVEMTNLIDAQVETKGCTLVYLPKYTAPDDPLLEADDDEIWRRFSAFLYRMHPTLHSSDIFSRLVLRARHVQPVPTLNYAANAPGARTGIPRLYVANTAQIVNDTLNNNAMVRIARSACASMVDDLNLSQPRAASPRELCAMAR